MIYGYARVSTVDQNLGGQVDALMAAGAEVVFQDKATGANRNRPELERLLAALAPGDTLLVVRLDRLARSTLDLIGLVDGFLRQGVAFRSITEPWADATSPQGKMLLGVFGCLAQFERELTLQRIAEGTAAAKARGVRFGRKSKLTQSAEREVVLRLSQGEGVRYLARVFGVSPAAIVRCRQRHQAKCELSVS